MKRANIIIMNLTGILLLIGSVLKSHHLLTEPILSKGFWESWEFFVIQIPLEIGLGIWLCSGLFRKVGWLLGLLAFGVFIVVSSYKVATGAESCPCFGKLLVAPWITLYIIDIPIFLLLAIFRPRDCKFIPPPWPSAKHFFVVAIPTAIILAVIIPVLLLNEVPPITESWEEHSLPSQDQKAASAGEQAADSQEEPEKWALLDNIDIADSLLGEIAVVLLYHHDCPDCAEAIPIYDQFSKDFQGSEDAFRFAFIEIPPYAPAEKSPIPSQSLCLSGKLDRSEEWIFQTPVVVVLWDGILVKRWEEGYTPQLDEILEAVFPSEE